MVDPTLTAEQRENQTVSVFTKTMGDKFQLAATSATIEDQKMARAEAIFNEHNIYRGKAQNEPILPLNAKIVTKK